MCLREMLQVEETACATLYKATDRENQHHHQDVHIVSSEGLCRLTQDYLGEEEQQEAEETVLRCPSLKHSFSTRLLGSMSVQTQLFTTSAEDNMWTALSLPLPMPLPHST